MVPFVLGWIMKTIANKTGCIICASYYWLISINSCNNSMRVVQPSLPLYIEAKLLNKGSTARKWPSHDSNLGPFDPWVHTFTTMLSIRWRADFLWPALPTTSVLSLNSPSLFLMLQFFEPHECPGPYASVGFVCLFLHTKPSFIMHSLLWLDCGMSHRSRFNSNINFSEPLLSLVELTTPLPVHHCTLIIATTVLS